MKRVSLFLVVFAVVAASFAGCKKEEDKFGFVKIVNSSTVRADGDNEERVASKSEIERRKQEQFSRFEHIETVRRAAEYISFEKKGRGEDIDRDLFNAFLRSF